MGMVMALVKAKTTVPTKTPITPATAPNPAPCPAVYSLGRLVAPVQPDSKDAAEPDPQAQNTVDQVEQRQVGKRAEQSPGDQGG